MRRSPPTVIALGVALFTGCTDPVRDRAIEALGPEDPAVPRGPDHRPGQPCLLCHSEGGPASGKPFAVAGTVYLTPQAGSDGAPGVPVDFQDTRGSAPSRRPKTSASGNFFVYESEWPNMTFPFRVRLLGEDGAPVQLMTTTVNREGSCNFCHRPIEQMPPGSSQAEFERRYYGQIYLNLQ